MEVVVLVCAYRSNSIRRYFVLNLYVACEVIASIVRFEILHHYGLLSANYAYFYYYSDCLLTILLFFALSSLYSQVFHELHVGRYVQFGALFLLSATALFSFAVVQQSSAKLLSHFVFELSQNLYFVGLVLTYILWAAILKLRETRAQLIQLVLSLGIYFSLYAANYALRNLYPSMGTMFQSMNPVIGCFLPCAWSYAFARISQDARLAPSNLAVIPR
jgi:hypothetical protein